MLEVPIVSESMRLGRHLEVRLRMALLRKLPDLPPELEYRLVGRSLILRDVKANLIVDILRDVVPTIPS